jgi:hypothetical protein
MDRGGGITLGGGCAGPVLSVQVERMLFMKKRNSPFFVLDVEKSFVVSDDAVGCVSGESGGFRGFPCWSSGGSLTWFAWWNSGRKKSPLFCFPDVRVDIYRQSDCFTG